MLIGSRSPKVKARLVGDLLSRLPFETELRSNDQRIQVFFFGKAMYRLNVHLGIHDQNNERIKTITESK